ncbi:unnamed protein product [Parnassius apollo]|uniref:(apollo) hypothetical protein n=1 Tax=Parnassius apollo TaxID=110799 RepID=A0A8S3X809_PARAO|nr:unnamed protein product [Parnassius apollo]
MFAIILVCAQAFLVQTISAYCLGSGFLSEAPLAAATPCAATCYGCYGAGCGLAAIPTASGGGFSVSSFSPIPPVGVSVLSKNEIGGILSISRLRQRCCGNSKRRYRPGLGLPCRYRFGLRPKPCCTNQLQSRYRWTCLQPSVFVSGCSCGVY